MIFLINTIKTSIILVQKLLLFLILDNNFNLLLINIFFMDICFVGLANKTIVYVKLLSK